MNPDQAVTAGRFAALATAAMFAITTAGLFGCVPPAKLRVVNYCDLPRHECSPLGELPAEIQAQLQEQSWCCTSGEPCVPVASITDCSITDVAIYCEFGRSTPASTEGGTSGFECFD
jgi:hypothetical protein